VEEGESPKGITSKLEKNDSTKAPAETRSDESKSVSTASRPNVSGMEQTMDSAATGMFGAKKGLDETVSEDAGHQDKTVAFQTNGIEETMQSNLITAGSPPSSIDATVEAPLAPTQTKSTNHGKTATPSERDFSVDQATVESGASQGSNTSNNTKTSTKNNAPIPERLGGYKIVRELGAGGMGSVYLARQLSLDRPCALKTIQAQWASNPRVIARFVREAYAAAQLTHHNVVQIYDLGQDRGTNFFSMELVGGGSLDEQIKSKGKLPPKLAATLVLQASRGLKFAHDHGMVHRDIKPANLMMTTDGLVKIADLGLVKTPSAEDEGLTRGGEEIEKDTQAMMLESARSQVTLVGASMGTPAYMSPEQSEDAANVDKRADIYSLGCTFYALLTGKPPYAGKTMVEVITKHRVEKLVRPERVIEGLDPKLGDIIEKMTAKLPADRYQDLSEVIHDLEIFLELREGAYFTQGEGKPTAKTSAATNKPESVEVQIPADVIQPIEVAAKRYQESPLLLGRRFAPIGWYGLTGFLAVISLIMALLSFFTMVSEGAKSIAAVAADTTNKITGNEGTAVPAPASNQTSASPSVVAFRSMVSSLKSAIGYAIAGLLAPFAVIAVAGFQNRSPLAKKYRESFLAGGILNFVYWSFSALLALLAIHYLGLWLPVILGVLFGGMAAAAYYFGIEKTLQQQRQGALEMAQNALRLIRLRGIDEERIQQTVATKAGRNWEELFEHLFGYTAKRSMRTKLQTVDREKRNKFLPLRDAMIDRCDQQAEKARRAQEEKVLIATEKAELVAKGIPESEAKRQAEQTALSMIEAATETRVTMQELASGALTADAAEAKRKRIKQMLAEAKSGKVSKRERSGGSLMSLIGLLFGAKLRFAAAALLLVATGMWAQENQAAVEKYWQQARSSVEALKDSAVEGGIGNAVGVMNEAANASGQMLAQTTKVPWKSVLGGLVHERNILFIAAAGIVLLLGTILSHWKLSMAALPVAVLLLAASVIV
jgi:serine/threonine protein kinase